MRTVRLAVVGLQHGRDHVRAIEAAQGVALAAGSDLKPELAPEVERHGARFYTDYRRMLAEERPDGVILAVPHHLHEEMTATVAEAGCAVLVEKPIAMTLPEADRMIAACRAHGVPLAVGLHRRFERSVGRAREAVRAGRLGTVLHSRNVEVGFKSDQYFERRPWMDNARYGGGPLFMNTIHTLDALRYVVDEIAEVYAVLSHRGRGWEVEDGAAAVLRYWGGASGVLLSGDASPGVPDRDFVLYGTEGTLDVHGSRLWTVPDRYTEGGRAADEALAPSPEEAARPADAKVVQTEDFARAIRGEGAPLVSGEEGRQSLAVLLALRESGRTGRPVRVGAALQ